MSTVGFTSMAEGTAADYELLRPLEERFVAEVPDRLFAARDRLKQSFVGYQVDRYEHSLQERYDQNCFDANYDMLPLKTLVPLVREVFAEPRHLDSRLLP